MIAFLLLGGVVNAQSGWDTDPNSHDWSSNTPIVATVSIEGVAQTDLTNLTLGAFAGDELRGRAYVANNSVYNNQFWIQVFYNYNTTENISFKLYDAATETEYAVCLVTKPTQDGGWGTPSNPVVLNFTNAPGTETQTITLSAGTNWVSFYVDITLDDLKGALVATGNSSIRILSQNSSTQYTNGRWRGNITWDLTKMFKIEVNNACELTLEGMLVNPEELQLTITNGANWIAFPLTESMTVATAFNGFAFNGDILGSQTVSAQYNNGRWRGQLSTLVPGQGYIYTSASSETRTFTFPTGTSKVAPKAPQTPTTVAPTLLRKDVKKVSNGLVKTKNPNEFKKLNK